MKKSFTGTLISLDDPGSANLGWKVIDIPFDVKKVFGKAGRLPVRGDVNGFPFRTSLFPRKNGKHFLLVNKKVQHGADISLGSKAKVTIEFDEEERTVEIPAILKKEIEEDKDLLRYFTSLNYSTRKYMSDMIADRKSAASKKKQTERIAEILVEMRDGEENPPPILEAEFARNPKARKGWNKMTASHKRGHLWGIFYYQNPESRMKRLQKAVEQMVAYAEK